VPPLTQTTGNPGTTGGPAPPGGPGEPRAVGVPIAATTKTVVAASRSLAFTGLNVLPLLLAGATLVGCSGAVYRLGRRLAGSARR
jgi:hypothetical protein